MRYEYSPQDPNKVPTQFSNRVTLRHKDHHLASAFAWCSKNIDTQYQYDIVTLANDLNDDRVVIYSFAKPEDAMAFKLRWI